MIREFQIREVVPDDDVRMHICLPLPDAQIGEVCSASVLRPELVVEEKGMTVNMPGWMTRAMQFSMRAHTPHPWRLLRGG
jgi:hypothetical protein